MSEKEIIDIISKVVATSIPGYVSYYFLYKTNRINLSKNRTDENKVILTILSAINIFVGLSVYKKLNTYNNLFISFIIIVVLTSLSILIIPYVAPKCSNLFDGVINFYRKKDELGAIDNESRYTKIFDHNKKTIVAIFDFSRNYVISGVAESIPLDNEFEYFDMILSKNVDKVLSSKIDEDQQSKMTESEFVQMFNKKIENGKAETYNVYVDFEKKIKIHVLTFKGN